MTMLCADSIPYNSFFLLIFVSVTIIGRNGKSVDPRTLGGTQTAPISPACNTCLKLSANFLFLFTCSP
jgi:hypothetical protein